ncbi:MAG: hypothetical protein K2W95_06910 [Candidatus Obscuribacterales bacterium]|nr:hypothetical protein [Candidatus Obscuribacterales bacterium]
MTGAEKSGVNHANRIRSMSREYFLTALKELPEEMRVTVERQINELNKSAEVAVAPPSVKPQQTRLSPLPAALAAEKV